MTDPSRLIDSGDEFERLLVRSAKLDLAELEARRELRESTAARARQALAQRPKRVPLVALGLGLCAAAAAVVLALRPTPKSDPPPTAEAIPTRSVPAPSPAKSASPPKVELEPCAAVVVATGNAPLIDDFEDRNARLLIQDGRAGSWLSNGDPKAKVKPRPGTTAFPVAIPKGREQSRYALHFTGEQIQTGAGLDAYFVPGKCYDASAYTGVEVWAKGPGRIHVMIAMTDVIERKWGGSCDTKCYDPHRIALDLSADWQRYSVRWDELKQVGYGTPLGFDEKRLWSIQFFVDSADSPFDVWLDDVAFVKR